MVVMCATAEAGREVLRRGGNAVDAGAVMQFMLNVVQPSSTGASPALKEPS